MMHYLPLDPYHRNLTNYWRKNSSIHLNYDFWSWVKENHNTVMTNRNAIDGSYWQFENERDMVAFAMRWG